MPTAGSDAQPFYSVAELIGKRGAGAVFSEVGGQFRLSDGSGFKGIGWVSAIGAATWRQRSPVAAAVHSCWRLRLAMRCRTAWSRMKLNGHEAIAV